MDEKDADKPLVISKTTFYALFVVSSLVTVLIVFKLIRPYFNKKVVCWFCHQTSSIPYGNKNCWDCVHCEQYNGFTKDGDYNKAIPAQHDEDLNHPINCSERSSFSNVPSTNKLCEKCNRNQLLKVKQLANFTPSCEERFDEEVEIYEKKLEQAYKLCFRCERSLDHELRKQNEILRPKVLRHLRATRLQRQPAASESTAQRHPSLVIQTLLLCVKVVVLSLVVLDLFIFISTLPTFKSIKLGYLSHITYVLGLYRDKFLKITLMAQLVILAANVFCYGRQTSDLLHIVFWLLSYGHMVLTNHKLLPGPLMSPLVSVVLHTITFVTSCTRRSVKISADVNQRSPNLQESNTWSSLASNPSDSGLSMGHPFPDDISCDDYEAMDCAASVMSSLNLEEESPRSKSYHRPPTPSVIRPPTFGSRSTGAGSVRSFHTAAPSLASRHHGVPATRSASRSSFYSQPTGYLPSEPSLRLDAMSGRPSTPPSVSNYMSVRSSPDSPTSSIYSHMPVVPYDQRVPPEKTSLLTQILLGVSLGVNISIAAFILGRYSVNGDLFSFV